MSHSQPRLLKRFGLLFLFSLACLTLLFGVQQQSTRAASFTIADGDVAALISALNAANASTTPTTINLATNGTYTLTAPDNINPDNQDANGLPVISGTVTIMGNGSTIVRSPNAPAFRFFKVVPIGNLSVDNLTLREGVASNGFGGSAIVNLGGKVSINVGNVLNNGAASGSSQNAVANIFSGTLVISNSLFSNNNNAHTFLADGGAIYSESSFLTVTNTSFQNNSGGTGGAIYNQGGSAYLDRARFEGNLAERGGAIFNTDSGMMRVSHSSFISNTAQGRGGAIENEGMGSFTPAQHEVTLLIDNSTFMSNTALAGGGGAILNDACDFYIATVVITNSNFISNSAQFTNTFGSSSGGGAIASSPVIGNVNLDITGSTFQGNSYAGDNGGGGAIFSASDQQSVTGQGQFISNASLKIVNSTFYANVVSGTGTSGGAIYSSGSHDQLDPHMGGTAFVTLTNATLVNNSAVNNAQVGGIYNVDGEGVATLVLSNTLLAANSGANCGGPTGVSSDLANLEYPAVVTCGSSSQAVATLPVQSGPPQDHGGLTPTILLAPSSPAIDAGNLAVCSDHSTVNSQDQRGVVRPLGNGCDIGAVEAGGLVVTENSDDGQGRQAGTLSFALKNGGGSDKTVVFALKNGSTITVTGTLPALLPGMSLLAGCGPNGPQVLIKGQGATGPGLLLKGNNVISGLAVSGFNGVQLKIQGGANQFHCTRFSKAG